MPTCSARSTADSTHLLGLGGTRALEHRLAAIWEMRYAVAMPSATTGLMAVGLALDVRGASFATTPLTYGATVGAWCALGARPWFADVHADTLTLRPDAVWRSRRARTRVLLAADLFGMPCDDEGLRRVADELGAWYVLDAAQGFGARRSGRPTGSRADAVVLSFTCGKTLDAGEGGAVLTNSRDLYERLVWHSQHPYRQKRELGLHRVNELAINGRLHPAVARIVLDRLEQVDDRLATRRQQVADLLAHLECCPHVLVPRIDPDVEPSWLRVTVRTCSRRVDALGAWLADAGWPVAPDPLPVMPLYRHASLAHLRDVPASCPVAEREWRQRVWLRERAGISLLQPGFPVERMSAHA